MDEAGHDGSEIVWPDEPEPYRRKAFHWNEMQRVAYNLGYLMTQFVTELSYRPAERLVRTMEYTFDISGPIAMYDGILMGKYRVSHTYHAVAWNHTEERIYDPMGRYQKLDNFRPYAFCAVVSR